MKEKKSYYEEYDNDEAELAAQEWGIKEGLRLFGVSEFYYSQKDGTEIPVLRGYYIDPGYKTLLMIYFTVKETKGKITLAKGVTRYEGKGKDIGFKYPIKIMRTKNFITKGIIPIWPLFAVLLRKKIILPFQSTMKQKDWQALPFEDDKGLKSTAI
jgi:hypothetical protein